MVWKYHALGELEKSDKYFAQVFELKPGYYDYINYGHVQWALGNKKDAIELYIQSLRDLNFEMDEEIFDLTIQRVTDEAKTGNNLGALSSFFKYYATELNIAREELNKGNKANYVALIEYFDKYQAFCFDLSLDSVLKGDLNFKYR